MCELKINFNQVEKAISVMREVSSWGRKQGYRVCPRNNNFTVLSLSVFLAEYDSSASGDFHSRLLRVSDLDIFPPCVSRTHPATRLVFSYL